MLPGLGNDSDVWLPYATLNQLRPSDEDFSFTDVRAQWLNVTGHRKPDR